MVSDVYQPAFDEKGERVNRRDFAFYFSRTLMEIDKELVLAQNSEESRSLEIFAPPPPRLRPMKTLHKEVLEGLSGGLIKFSPRSCNIAS